MPAYRSTAGIHCKVPGVWFVDTSVAVAVAKAKQGSAPAAEYSAKSLGYAPALPGQPLKLLVR